MLRCDSHVRFTPEAGIRVVLRQAIKCAPIGAPYQLFVAYISDRCRSRASPAEAGSPPDEVAQPRRRRPARGFLSALNVANRGQSEKIRARCLATADMKPELHANLIGFAVGAIAFSVTKSDGLPLPGGDDI